MAITQDSITAVRAMAMEDLFALNKLIVEQIRWRQSQKSFEARRKFNIGDFIEFWSRKQGRHVRIRIDSIGPKNLIGQEVNAMNQALSFPMRWTVSPSIANLVS